MPSIHSILSVTVLLLVLPSVISSSQPSELCQLQAQNISLLSKDSVPFYMTRGPDNLRIYLSLCHPLPLDQLPQPSLCDSGAFACITKIDQDNREVEFMRNAGSNSSGIILETSRSGVGISYSGGSSCKDANGKQVSYTTNVDFICTKSEDVMIYQGSVHQCTSQVFWQTRLACLPGQMKTEKETGSCILDIPGYDVRLDLSSWSHPEYFLARSSPEDTVKRYFQLNLCNPVVNGIINY